MADPDRGGGANRFGKLAGGQRRDPARAPSSVATPSSRPARWCVGNSPTTSCWVECRQRCCVITARRTDGSRDRRVAERNDGIDLTPLRVSTQYRRLYIAGFVTALGSQATYVAVPYQLRLLTHSTLAVGSIGLAELLPLIVFGLYGGVLADRLNRRRLIISMELVLMLSTAVLFVNALLPHPQAWILYADAFVASGAGSLQRPEHRGIESDVRAARIAARGVDVGQPAIHDGVDHRTRDWGPRGGRVRSRLGLRRQSRDVHPLLGLALLRLRATADQTRDSTTATWRRCGPVLRYALSRPDIIGTYIIDLLAMILAFPVVMLPFVAARFHDTYALAAVVLRTAGRSTRRVTDLGLVAPHSSLRPGHRRGRGAVGTGYRALRLFVLTLAGAARTRDRRRRRRDQWHLSHDDVE